MFKKYSSKVINIFILVLLVFLVYQKVPTIYNNVHLQSTKINNTVIQRISGEEISVPDIRRNKIIVFWATWCGPCRYELKKLNAMISQGEIKPDDLIAVSIDEKKEDVLKFMNQENYQFLVAHDLDGSLSRKFNISATPTVMFINKNSNLDWVSSGISPTLEKRAKEFLKD